MSGSFILRSGKRPPTPGRALASMFREDAERYAKAADLIEQADDRQFQRPAAFLRSHAVELLLKAYLLGHGWSEDALRKPKMRHELEKLLEESTAAGLSISTESAVAIRRMAGPHAEHWDRYARHGVSFSAQPAAIVAAIDELLETIARE